MDESKAWERIRTLKKRIADAEKERDGIIRKWAAAESRLETLRKEAEDALRELRTETEPENRIKEPE